MKLNREKRCENCGNTEWLGKPIPLEVHHKDGNRQNNSYDNLQLLCCNCHAQTDNFRGKARRKRDRITDEQIIEACKTAKNIRQLLLELGLTPKGGDYKCITNRLKSLGLLEDFQNKFEMKKCETCNIDFVGPGRYCSESCSPKRVTRNNPRREPKREQKQKICQFCGKEYNGVGKKFCSYKCSSKSNRIVERPTKEEILKIAEEIGYSATGRLFGVSDNAIRKWLK